MEVYSGTGSPTVTFTVTARDRTPNSGCPLETLNMTAVGQPASSYITAVRLNPAVGEVAYRVTVYASAPRGTYNITYRATDTTGNSTSVTLPLRVIGTNDANTTPVLDPISDLALNGESGEVKYFTIGVTDSVDRDLITTGGGLVIDGLPSNAEVYYTHVGLDRIAAIVAVQGTQYNIGLYTVHITGRDTKGGW